MFSEFNMAFQGTVNLSFDWPPPPHNSYKNIHNNMAFVKKFFNFVALFKTQLP